MNHDKNRTIIKKLEPLFFGHGTCSIEHPVSGCVTFARYFPLLVYHIKNLKGLFVMINADIFGYLIKSDVNASLFSHESYPGVVFYLSEDLDYEFTVYHNWVNRFASPVCDKISRLSNIDPAAVIGAEGVHLAVSKDGERVQMKHLGNLVIEDDVIIGAGAVIQRGVLSSTILKRGCYIDVLCNIGHGAEIGEDTTIAAGAIIGGSAKIGKRCWIGLNSTIKNGITICDDVVIGSGSNVYRDIKSPGIWVGNPAVRKGSYDPKTFNF